MSVIVKGMEMPRMCAECDFMGSLLMDEGIYTCDCPVDTICGMNISDEIEKDCRHPNCPLVALPDKHGDLIARDGILQSLIAWSVSGEVKSIEDIMDEQDIIVEAEDRT